MRRHHGGKLKSIIRLGLALGCLVGCNDGRVPKKQAVRLKQVQTNNSSSLRSVATVRFQNGDTETLTMRYKAGSLFVTGRPFGFSRWDVSANPENPSLIFAASDQIDTFAPNGKWVVDWYASGALGLLGRYAFLSGTAGMSIIDIGETGFPREVKRIPFADPNSDQVPRDLAYVYRAIAEHPTQRILYGFREQDFVYTLRVGSDVQLVRKDAYGGQGQLVCCVKSATVFGNRVFVAFGGKLVWFELSPSGNLSPGGKFDGLQAQNVASTERYLYVQHNPSYGHPAGVRNPRGFYVFDRNGENVDYIASNDNPILFAVNGNDSHFYMNKGTLAVEIFRIVWGARQ